MQRRRWLHVSRRQGLVERGLRQQPGAARDCPASGKGAASVSARATPACPWPATIVCGSEFGTDGPSPALIPTVRPPSGEARQTRLADCPGTGYRLRHVRHRTHRKWQVVLEPWAPDALANRAGRRVTTCNWTSFGLQSDEDKHCNWTVTILRLDGA